MTKVYLIRHAEAEGNLYRRIHGQYNSKITQRGHRQIAALEKRFAQIPVDFIYSSDLFRTIKTAGAIDKSHGLELALTPQLREVGMGVWEDLTWGEVERFEKEQLDHFNNAPVQWKIDGCEAFDTLQKRMTRAILKIAEKHDGSTVAVVSHGSAIRAFICGILGIPPHEIRRVKHCDNTSVTLLNIDGDNVDVEYYGDNSHLPEALSTLANQKWWRENIAFDSTNLRFVPFDLTNDAGRYLRYRRSAWEDVCGPQNGDADKWLAEAKSHAQAHSRAVSMSLIYDTAVGAIELDTKKSADEKTGIIEFLYMESAYRRTGIAVQLIGQAVSVYRSLGREKIRMNVSEKNEKALGYCEKYGFCRNGTFNDICGKHYVMELNIALQ